MEESSADVGGGREAVGCSKLSCSWPVDLATLRNSCGLSLGARTHQYLPFDTTMPAQPSETIPQHETDFYFSSVMLAWNEFYAG